jgi:signal peptidase I
MENKLKKYTTNVLKSWAFSLVTAFLIAASVQSSLADWNDVPTGSMQPTILTFYNEQLSKKGSMGYSMSNRR